MTLKRYLPIALAVALVGALAGALACVRSGLGRSAPPVAAFERRHEPVRDLGPAELELSPAPAGSHRLLLDPQTLARLEESARAETAAFRYTRARADEAVKKTLRSGYQGFDWADALAHCALIWHATGEERYAKAALGYLEALLDDRFVVGDAQGGAAVVRHDSGYGIRTFGAYTALGYDWLRNAPGMGGPLRARILERLEQWLAWYRTDGYLNDRPTANYYWGYLTTLAFAGLAAAGESPRADEWLELARGELATKVLPLFREELRGGGWPEGAQYGDYTTAEIALVARAFRTAAGIDVASQLPWLAETVTFYVHALLPDGRSVYDGGTWGEHPAKPSPLALTAALLVLDDVNPNRAAEARWMLRHALPPLRRERSWVALLADRPGAPERSPRRPGVTSLHVPGMGLSFARSDWSPSAVWTSFQAGPRLAADHQDNDQGHFEVARGSDILLVDGGGVEGLATINHNTLLVDDGGRTQTYPPNQGVWGHAVRTTRFGDDGSVVLAAGDIGEAYAPACVREGCTKRVVEKLERSLVFVRPSLVVVHDRIRVDRPDVAVTWAAHVTVPPAVNGAVTSAVVGASRVDVTTLEPAHARPVALREPTPSKQRPHERNQPWGPMWRIEVPTPRDARDRTLLHFVAVGPAAATPAPVRRVAGNGLSGGVTDLDGRRTVVLFAADEQEPGSVALGSGSLAPVVVAGLAPGRHYNVSVDAERGCTLEVRATQDARAPRATSGGFLRTSADCGGR